MSISITDKELEEKINKEFGEEILNCQTFKRKKSIKYPEIFLIALFLGLSLGSSLAGLYLAKVNFTMALIIDLIVHIVIALIIYTFVRRKIIAIEELK